MRKATTLSALVTISMTVHVGGCGGGAAVADAGNLEGGREVSPRDAGRAPVADAGLPGERDARPDVRAPDAGFDAGPAPIDVQGAVTDGSGAPIADRAVDALDAAGLSHVALTDAAGKFSMSHVLPPYALTVEAPAGVSPMIYLGLETTKPRVVGNGSTTPLPSTSSAQINATLSLPDCGGTCTVFPATFAAGESGGGYGSFTAAPLSTVPLGLDRVAWSGSGPATAGVDVLVANAALSSYWYAEVSFTATNGDVADLGTITPSPVATVYPWTVSLTSSALPPEWPAPMLGVELVLPRNNRALLLNAPGPSLAVAVPDISGTTVSVFASSAIRGDGGPSDAADAFVERGELAPGAKSASVEIYPPATWVEPPVAYGGSATEGLISSLKWSPYSGAPSGFSVLQLATATPTAEVVCTVLTSDAEVSLAALAKMGVILAPATYTVALLEVRPDASVNELAERGKLVATLSFARPHKRMDWADSEITVTLTP